MVYLDRDPAAASLIHESCGFFDRLRSVHFRSLRPACSTGDVDGSSGRCHGLFRCMRMLCGILRLYIARLGDSSTAAMSLVIVEIFRAVPSPSSARSAAAQTGLLATPRAHQR